MVSYKPKKDKIVLLLSSKHNRPEIGEKNKPTLIHYYKKTKGGVDVLDIHATGKLNGGHFVSFME